MVGDLNYTSYQDVNVPEFHYTIRNDKKKNSPNYDTSDKNSKSEKTKPFFSRSAIDIKKFTNYLSSINTITSSQKCARSIRIALQSAGANIHNHPVAAADWGGTLVQLGFKKISPAFSNPQRGDIYIIKRTSKHSYGHIAGFSGSQWVSDFKQRSHDVYRDDGVKYEYYRLASN